MLTLSDPGRAYRRVQRDAAILGSDSRALTLLCYDEFLEALASALHADAHELTGLLRQALDRASTALSAIRAGTDADHPMAAVLGSMFDAADRAVRGAMVRFHSQSIEAIKDDFTDIRAALSAVEK